MPPPAWAALPAQTLDPPGPPRPTTASAPSPGTVLGTCGSRAEGRGGRPVERRRLAASTGRGGGGHAGGRGPWAGATAPHHMGFSSLALPLCLPHPAAGWLQSPRGPAGMGSEHGPAHLPQLPGPPPARPLAGSGQAGAGPQPHRPCGAGWPARASVPATRRLYLRAARTLGSGAESPRDLGCCQGGGS